MIKKTGFALALLAIMFFSVPLYANDDMKMEEKNDDKEMMAGKMMKMHGMMMKHMSEKSVVATADGGIVIVTGNKITKYDKDLNLVKEVETEMDMGDMQGMMGKCKMMKDHQETNDAAPAAAEDHSAHH